MFDDDDQFDLADDPFEWDMLLDDDELERDRKKRQDKNAQGDASKKARQAPSRTVRRVLWITAASLRLYT